MAHREPEQLIDLGGRCRWHLVGAGGPGMAPLAWLLRAAGQEVTGSDRGGSPVLDRLRAAGMDVRSGHDAAAVEGADIVVYSTAIPADNVEIAEARRLGIRVAHRSVALASLCAATGAVGVAGAHGKTTTSALLHTMLTAHRADVAAYIGAEVRGVDDAATPDVRRAGATLVVEADESDGTIEVLPLSGIAVTNIDLDHLDYWGDLEGIVAGFVRVVSRVAARGGTVVVNIDDPSARALVGAAGRGLRTFGWSPKADVQVVSCADTGTGIDVVLSVDRRPVRCALPLRGMHNAMNLACALAVATSTGLDPGGACAAVETFAGVDRRFTERGRIGGALVIDDYAHLPAEIAATIAAVRSHPERRGAVVAVFQPNRFHRIAAMAGDYADCFAGADSVVITDIYASGTEPIPGVTGQLVVDAVAHRHPSVTWAPTRAEVVAEVRSRLAPGDVCIGMGCGDISTLFEDLQGARR